MFARLNGRHRVCTARTQIADAVTRTTTPAVTTAAVLTTGGIATALASPTGQHSTVQPGGSAQGSTDAVQSAAAATALRLDGAHRISRSHDRLAIGLLDHDAPAVKPVAVPALTVAVPAAKPAAAAKPVTAPVPVVAPAPVAKKAKVVRTAEKTRTTEKSRTTAKTTRTAEKTRTTEKSRVATKAVKKKITKRATKTTSSVSTRSSVRSSRSATRAAAATTTVVPVKSAFGGIIGLARSYSGIFYVWGGTTPAGFDCSGFTQYLFKKHGVNLPRTAEAQRRATTRVHAPRVGDLVFFGAPAFHVGIYAGNGMMYDAPRTGKTTGLHKIWSKNVSYGRP